MSASPYCLIDVCRVYRDAQARYARAFVRGDVREIEDSLSRMQEIGRAFRDGARWATEGKGTMGARPR